MITGYHHTAISTPDIDRAVSFYCDHLGFTVLQDIGWPKGTKVADEIHDLRDSAVRSVMVGLPGGTDGRIEFFQYESPEPKPGDPNRPVCDHGITHLCVLTDDIEADYERLKKAGMRFHCPPHFLGTFNATYGRDPDGNVIELLQNLHSPE